MEGYRKSEGANGALTKKHFAKFHERIQNKYIEMQKKIHKARSVDSISCLSDDFIVEPSIHSSTADVTIDDAHNDEVFAKVKSEKTNAKYSIIVEDVNKQDVTILDCDLDNVYESAVLCRDVEIREKAENNIFFGDDFSSSFESLSEELREDNKASEEVPPSTPTIQLATNPTPSPKISIRDKIGTRITAARERRREIKDKKEEKKEEKKRESLDPVDKKQFILSNKSIPKKTDSTKKKQKVASVTVALIEATGVDNEAASDEKTRWFYCRIRLGAEKRKSKSAKRERNLIKFQELFHLGLFDDNLLEISMCDKDSTIGKAVVDLSTMEREKTHRMRLNLEEGLGSDQIFILLTISGVTLVNTFVDFDDYQETHRKFEALQRKYSWMSLCRNISDVGWASVIVYGAKGLSSNDTYCILELENERRETPTEHKTNDPNWMKIMEFNIQDITSILIVSVFDEKKSEPIGRAFIPLLKVENGKKKWYALKDSNHKDRAKGNNPRILLEMKLFYNLIKASLRVIYPKEQNLLETKREFSRHVFSQNVARAKAVINWTLDAFRVTKSLFEWESRQSNAIALSLWLVFWWIYKAWMLPLLLLIPFIMYRPPEYYFLLKPPKPKVEESEDKEEKNKSLIKKINSLQDLIQTVQNSIGKVAEFGESVKNLCNFTVPFLSFLAIFIILLVSFVLYLVPVRYILMGWGIHKFLRKILRPNRIPNNEILDLLSRVPDDETLLECEDLPVLELTEEDKID